MPATPDWLEIERGTAPLVIAFPHTGADLADVEGAFFSPWLARRDADWYVEKLYAFARDMGATTIRTRIARTVIDMNRDPSGASLYPGQATTGLCPTTSFDGQPIYAGEEPDAAEVERRKENWFHPYHAAIRTELDRLRADHPRVVLYDAHSIRSHIPRLFDGELPQFNIGTDNGKTCDPALEQTVEAICAASGESHVLNGRFRGGWTTRHYGEPGRGIHAIQMELAIRGYMDEPETPDETNWPRRWNTQRAAPLIHHLQAIIRACLAFATH